jgi:hypothetical protein
MSPNELRIGNLTDKGVIQNLLESGIHVGRGKCFNYSEVKPVPLTKEQLLKSGFEKTEGYNHGSHTIEKVPYFSKDDITVILYNDGEFWYAVPRYDGGTGEEYIDVVELKHVHKLQNLYFALEGKELTL